MVIQGTFFKGERITTDINIADCIDTAAQLQQRIGTRKQQIDAQVAVHSIYCSSRSTKCLLPDSFLTHIPEQYRVMMISERPTINVARYARVICPSIPLKRCFRARHEDLAPISGIQWINEGVTAAAVSSSFTSQLGQHCGIIRPVCRSAQLPPPPTATTI